MPEKAYPLIAFLIVAALTVGAAAVENAVQDHRRCMAMTQLADDALHAVPKSAYGRDLARTFRVLQQEEC